MIMVDGAIPGILFLLLILFSGHLLLQGFQFDTLLGQILLNFSKNDVVGLMGQLVFLDEVIEHLWDISGGSDGQDRVVVAMSHIDVDGGEHCFHKLLDPYIILRIAVKNVLFHNLYLTKSIS